MIGGEGLLALSFLEFLSKVCEIRLRTNRSYIDRWRRSRVNPGSKLWPVWIPIIPYVYPCRYHELSYWSLHEGVRHGYSKRKFTNLLYNTIYSKHSFRFTLSRQVRLICLGLYLCNDDLHYSKECGHSLLLTFMKEMIEACSVEETDIRQLLITQWFGQSGKVGTIHFMKYSSE